MQLAKGDVLRVPVATDQRSQRVRVCALFVESVHQTADGVAYCFRDHRGPAILIAHSRLRWLQQRFERELQGEVE